MEETYFYDWLTGTKEAGLAATAPAIGWRGAEGAWLTAADSAPSPAASTRTGRCDAALERRRRRCLVSRLLRPFFPRHRS